MKSLNWERKILIGEILDRQTNSTFTAEWIFENFGTNAWAEDKLGTSGGTRLLIKLIGLVVIFVSLLYMSGLFEGFLRATLGRLFMLK